jgi:hypothetical protein
MLPSLTSAPVTAPGASSLARTAFSRICVAPTLLRGSVAAA